MSIKKIFTLLVAVLAGLLLFASPSQAGNGNAHFIKNATGASLSGSSLVVHFKEAGLAAGSIETITASADALTTYECVNGGGKNPSASNKTTTLSRSSATGQFPVDQNGNLTGSLTLTPPSASSLGFSCPPGQTVTFVGVTYSNVVVNDTTSHVSTTIPGSFTYTNPLAP